MKQKKIPKYRIGILIFVALVFYFFMLTPVFFVYVIKTFPEFAIRNNLFERGIMNLDSIQNDFHLKFNEAQDELKKYENLRDSLQKHPDTSLCKEVQYYIDSLSILLDKQHQPNHPFFMVKMKENHSGYEAPMSLYLKFALIAWLLIFIVNFPIKRYFNLKRRGKTPSPRIENYTRRYIHWTAHINSFIIVLVYIVMHIIMFVNVNKFEPSGSGLFEKRIYSNFLIISIISSVLVVIFIYVWQRYRISSRYIEVIYTKDELKKRMACLPKEQISKKLFLTSMMTTFLPLLVVCFYLFTSISQIKELNLSEVSPQINQIFLGNFSKIFSLGSTINKFIYINSVDTLLMIYGIIVGTSVTLIYIAFFLRLSNGSIIKPIKELVINMKSFDKNSSENFSIVRSNDEIGVLAEEFNNMSDRINNYITEINKMNAELEQKVKERTAEIQFQKEEIETQRDEIEAQRDEIEQQRDYVITQRDQIAKQNKHITDSIAYARRIQTAVLLSVNEISDVFSESFIFFAPRDIVCGDFYFIKKIRSHIIIAAADCTGHGVPGLL